MYTTFFEQDGHTCIGYYDLVSGQGVQCNQFLIVDNGHAALLDPGGDLTYAKLYETLNDQITVKDLDYVIASHQDPDVVASVGRWMAGTDARLVVPQVWERFVLHFCRPSRSMSMDGRILTIPDGGAGIDLGDSQLIALPAHFLHSEANIQIYDPVSKILFTGDLGGSVTDTETCSTPVEDFDAEIPALEQFNQRLMCSNKICRYWVNMVRELDVEWIIPQHGPSYKGREMVGRFLDWIENLDCGVDLFTQDNYRVPRMRRKEDRVS
jgi:flavorubredoxin